MPRMLTIHYGIEITPAVFFGYSTLEKLTHYFLTEHQEAIQEFYEEAVVDQSDFPPEPCRGRVLQTPWAQAILDSQEEPGSQKMREPIAIIGMSGRFPQARNYC